MILAGDIGGTNTRLALFEGTPERLTPVTIEVFPSREYKGLEEIARKFLTKHNQTVPAACFGLPGAVIDGHVETSNLPWVVDGRSMAPEISDDELSLINDLEANPHGIALLEESDLLDLNPGIPN